MNSKASRQDNVKDNGASPPPQPSSVALASVFRFSGGTMIPGVASSIMTAFQPHEPAAEHELLVAEYRKDMFLKNK
jgi:hypothetical protein